MQIADFLAAVRQRLRRSILLEGCSRVLVVCIVTALGFFLLDRLAPLPALLRLLCALGYLYIIFDTLYWRLLRPLRADMSDRQLVHVMETRLSALNGRGFVFLDGLPLSAADSAAVDQLLHTEAVKQIVPAPHMRQWFMSSGGVCLVLLVLVGMNGAFFTTALTRLALPFGEREWDRATHISGHLERAVVAEDESFVFLCERHYGTEDGLQIAWVSTTGTAGSQRYERISSPWRQALQLPPGQYTFSIRSGDSLTVECQGQVIKRPQLAALALRVQAPAYARVDDQTADTFALRVLAGTQITFDVDFAGGEGAGGESAGGEDAGLKHVAVSQNGQELPLAQDAENRRRVHGAMQIMSASTVLITAVDEHQIAMKPAATFAIEMLGDEVPQVVMGGPRRREKVSVGAVVALRIDATDDYGVAQMHLHIRHEKTGVAAAASVVKAHDAGAAAPAALTVEEHRLMEHTYSDQTYVVREVTERGYLRVADYANVGERLIVHGEARDANDVTTVGIGRSNDSELLVVSEQVLRRDLYKRIAEVRERIQQSRSALMPALTDSEKVQQHALQAASLVDKADERLAHVLRRWSENGLPEPERSVLAQAQNILRVDAKDMLLQAQRCADAQRIDTALAQVYRLLSDAADTSDLSHELAALIEQEQALAIQSKAFVLKYSIQALDESARNAQRSLAERQQELAQTLGQWQQRLLEDRDSRYQRARETTRRERPAQQLSAAARDIASTDARQKSVGAQHKAIAILQTMYQQMNGSDATDAADVTKDIAKQLAELATRQAALAARMDTQQTDAAARAAMASEQQDIQAATEQARAALADTNADTNADRIAEQNAASAQQHLAGAVSAQQKAVSAITEETQEQAQLEAHTAAQLLKQAALALADEQADDAQQEEDDNQLEIVTLLKDMRRQQTKLVSDALVLHGRIGETQRIGFRQKRAIGILDAVEKKMLFTLENEAYPALTEAKQQIAIWGLKRVEAALQRTHTHLNKPALGVRGIELCQVVLREIDRLLMIIESLPRPSKSEDSAGPDGSGQGEASAAPFPKLAQLNLLAQAQEMILHQTMARYGKQLFADQSALTDIIAQLHDQARPSTRPALLLQRIRTAMQAARTRLEQQDMGVHTQNQQQLAVQALQQIMREATSQKSSGEGKPSAGQQQQADTQGQAGSQQGQEQAQDGADGNAQSDASQGAKDGQAAPTPVLTDMDPSTLSAEVQSIIEQRGAAWFLSLPPKVRQSLIELESQPLPPGAKELYRRYLENLEDMPE